MGHIIEPKVNVNPSFFSHFQDNSLQQKEFYRVIIVLQRSAELELFLFPTPPALFYFSSLCLLLWEQQVLQLPVPLLLGVNYKRLHRREGGRRCLFKRTFLYLCYICEFQLSVFLSGVKLG